MPSSAAPAAGGSSKRGRRDVALLLGPDPESADDGRDLGASARVPHRPRVDHLAEILGRDLERFAVGEQEAHSREDRLVVADRRLGGAVLVAEPAQVAADELAERRLAVRLVLHRLPDDPGGLSERQARAASVGAVGAVDRGLSSRSRSDSRRVAKERELVPRQFIPGSVYRVRRAVHVGMARSPISRQLLATRPRIRGDPVSSTRCRMHCGSPRKLRRNSATFHGPT